MNDDGVMALVEGDGGTVNAFYRGIIIEARDMRLLSSLSVKRESFFPKN